VDWRLGLNESFLDFEDCLVVIENGFYLRCEEMASTYTGSFNSHAQTGFQFVIPQSYACTTEHD
jgi:hypothetical protein